MPPFLHFEEKTTNSHHGLNRVFNLKKKSFAPTVYNLNKWASWGLGMAAQVKPPFL